ncbi:bifunctional DNA-formamidopyrimidine glycosylase/DNA-(apurinic or apyrimidinic site) lyase [Kocuria sp. M1R5S2]|uniref:bifunctional DNA-formamidopyrimidine glycosylase/DNA-(apurinic or apyrimidinic site) lyase n=1 Tax=Kocuria rhizosphaerae TaxID=3376285 RepID=UPI00379801A8
MPELPEVEVVRRGVERWVVGRTVEAVDVLDPRSVRRHAAGPVHFAHELAGAVVADAVRRGKFLWLPLDRPDGTVPQEALLVHLGMSGQLLVEDAGRPAQKHLKVRLRLSGRPGTPAELRFVDQRIFGGMVLDDLVPTDDGAPGGRGATDLPALPARAAHIARDPLDPAFDADALHDRLRRRRTGLKRALLDQGLVSGIGNIYADEALWLARLHWARPTDTLRRPETHRVLAAVREVMAAALAAGGTSFDSLYVNVNGESGYFARSLNAYGRAGRACSRCAGEGRTALIVREQFMNRSSYRCPVCQRTPRNVRS